MAVVPCKRLKREKIHPLAGKRFACFGHLFKRGFAAATAACMFLKGVQHQSSGGDSARAGQPYANAVNFLLAFFIRLKYNFLKIITVFLC